MPAVDVESFAAGDVESFGIQSEQMQDGGVDVGGVVGDGFAADGQAVHLGKGSTADLWPRVACYRLGSGAGTGCCGDAGGTGCGDGGGSTAASTADGSSGNCLGGQA